MYVSLLWDQPLSCPVDAQHFHWQPRERNASNGDDGDGIRHDEWYETTEGRVRAVSCLPFNWWGMVMPFGAVADLHFVPTIDLTINTSWKGNGEQTFFFYLQIP